MKLVKLSMALLGAAAICCAETASERLGESTTVLNEVMSASDGGVPLELLEKAQCIVIVPGLKKGAFIFGGKYGRGYIVCREASGRGWSAPAGITVEGGSFGFQIGGEEVDELMLVMNKGGVAKLLQSKFTLGGDASVAAGPVGRTLTAATDAQMHAEILTYSRSRGLFAGLSLGGATMRPDKSANRELYHDGRTNERIVMGKTKPPAAAAQLRADLMKYSSHKE